MPCCLTVPLEMAHTGPQNKSWPATRRAAASSGDSCGAVESINVALAGAIEHRSWAVLGSRVLDISNVTHVHQCKIRYAVDTWNDTGFWQGTWSLYRNCQVEITWVSSFKPLRYIKYRRYNCTHKILLQLFCWVMPANPENGSKLLSQTSYGLSHLAKTHQPASHQWCWCHRPWSSHAGRTNSTTAPAVRCKLTCQKFGRSN